MKKKNIYNIREILELLEIIGNLNKYEFFWLLLLFEVGTCNGAAFSITIRLFYCFTRYSCNVDVCLGFINCFYRGQRHNHACSQHAETHTHADTHAAYRISCGAVT